MDLNPGHISELLQNFVISCNSEKSSTEENNAEKLVSWTKFMEKISRSRSNKEKLEIVHPFFHWKPGDCIFSDEELSGMQKSSTTCHEFSRRVMEEADAGRWINAWNMANLIWAYGESDRDLIRGHMVRLHLLNNSKLYKNPELLDKIKREVTSLENLEKKMAGVENKDTDKENQKNKKENGGFKSKLSLRGNQMIKDIETFLATNKAKKMTRLNEERVAKLRALANETFRIRNPNPKSPAVENFVEIRETADRGRGLFVTKDVSIGTTLLVERPFSSILLDPFNSQLDHCHHCFTMKVQPVPCPSCAFALFCGEKCQKEAASYHQYECTPFLYIRSVILIAESPFCMALAFRMICQLGPELLFQTYQKTEKLLKHSDLQKSSDVQQKESIHSSFSYDTICSLQGGFNPHDVSSVCIALALTKVLEKKTGFFKKVGDKLGSKSVDHQQFQHFVATRILDHYEQIRVNCLPIVKLELVDQNMEDKDISERSRSKSNILEFEDSINAFGCALYATASIMNHSCDPNIILKWGPRFGEVVYIAGKSLRAGDELFNPYCPPFYDLDKHQRQAELWGKYKFECNCTACNHNWPTLNGQKSPPIFCCSKCVPKLTSEEKSGRVSLTKENGFKCPNCNSSYSEKKLLQEIQGHRLALEETRQSGSGKNINVNTINIVRNALLCFERNLVAPSKDEILATKFFDYDYMSVIQAIE